MKNIKEYFHMLKEPKVQYLTGEYKNKLLDLHSSVDDNTSLVLDALDHIKDYGEDSNIIGVFDEAVLVGFIHCAYFDDDSYFIKELSSSNFEYRIINGVTVRHDFRMRGIAEALIGYNIDLIKEEDGKPIVLFADPLTIQVVPFYTKQGFIERKDLYYKVFK